MQKEVVIIAILSLFAGIGIGWVLGFSSAIHQMVNIASGFIEIDYQTVYDALTQYENHILDCY